MDGLVTLWQSSDDCLRLLWLGFTSVYVQQEGTHSACPCTVWLSGIILYRMASIIILLEWFWFFQAAVEVQRLDVGGPPMTKLTDVIYPAIGFNGHLSDGQPEVSDIHCRIDHFIPLAPIFQSKSARDGFQGSNHHDLGDLPNGVRLVDGLMGKRVPMVM